MKCQICKENKAEIILKDKKKLIYICDECNNNMNWNSIGEGKI
jgi:protein-arginine kinase activator protein McsA